MSKADYARAFFDSIDPEQTCGGFAFGGAIGKVEPFAFSTMQHIVQRMRKATGKVDYVEALAH
jgi:hypothetical protein